MRHKGAMESRYTTNKGVLPEVLMVEMRNAYARSEAFLDQTNTAEADTLERRLEIQNLIQSATPHQLGHVLKALRAGKISQVATPVAN